ncbi:MAG: radical SAM protein [Planctomycetota bacterium]
MKRSIYLINPAADFPTYYGAEVYEGRGYKSAAFLADLVVPTLAAMVPSDFHVEICDEHLESVNFDLPVDYVGITGKISQWGNAKKIAKEFRRRGKVVLMGGPHASLCPEVVRPHCDILVRDEMEEIVDELFSDLWSGDYKEEYRGGRPDLALTPVPRWDLYAKYNDRVLTATVQTARGCPFECEFCDVIQYVGRKQRHKPIDKIIEELDTAYRAGYRSVLFADDNTTANRPWVKELFAAVRAWNHKQSDGMLSLSTQLSIDAARDDELLRMASEAGMTHVFIGIETPNEESLRESKKRQNLRHNLKNPNLVNPTLVDQIHRFLEHGIGVTAGMICGFDHDDHSTFDRQFEFAMASGVPICTLSALAAPHSTPLNDRLQKAGRLVDGYEVPGHPWNTNIIPERLTKEELTDGIRKLANQLYHPANFGERVCHYMDLLKFPQSTGQSTRHGQRRQALRTVDKDTLSLISDIPKLDGEAGKMWSRIMKKLPTNPNAAVPIMEAMIRYQQIRYMYETGNFWDAPQPLAETVI